MCLKRNWVKNQARREPFNSSLVFSPYLQLWNLFYFLVKKYIQFYRALSLKKNVRFDIKNRPWITNHRSTSMKYKHTHTHKYIILYVVYYLHFVYENTFWFAMKNILFGKCVYGSVFLVNVGFITSDYECVNIFITLLCSSDWKSKIRHTRRYRIIYLCICTYLCR